ncbi:MAG: single-stranded-DNA-specific exonuclease RecJ [Sphaerochaeta sp.]
MNWIKKKVEPDEVLKLHRRYKMDMLTCSILARRGIVKRDEVKYYLESELLYQHSPFEFEDMEEVVERIKEAESQGEKVRIFGDRDVDGITSTVLLKTELEERGIDCSYTVPDGEDPYGMTIEKVHKAHEEGITLFITVDCGISEIAEINEANKLGIDTIILDHHLSGVEIPDAYAIVDPKKEGTNYPFPHLAGCGVVAKTIWALRFSETELYNQEFILLHSQPGNDTIIIQAAKMRNFMVTDRKIEELNPGLVKASQSKILEFLNCGLPILVLDKQIEATQLSRAFGKAVDIGVNDLRENFDKTIPAIKGKSLFSLASISHTGRYSLFEKDELDVLIGMFNSVFLKNHPSLSTDYDKILDLVAIGTVADLMPMVDENRILLKRGLKTLSTNPRSSLLPLLSSNNLLGKNITTTNIGWNISPLLNSAGRLGQPKVAIDMLLAKDTDDIEEKSAVLLGFNKTRKKMGTDAWSKMQAEAKTSYEKFGTKMVLVYKADVYRGITGLMASRLLTQFKAPAMVISSSDDSDVLTGSMRSQKGFDILPFFEKFSDIFETFGGHSNAGGFSIKRENIPTLISQMENALDFMDCVEEVEECVDIDCTIPEEYMNPNLIKICERFEPYGQGNSPIVFQIQGATVIDYQFINGGKSGSRNVRLTLNYGTYSWPCIYWNGGDQVGKTFDKDSVVDCVFRLGRNYYNNQDILQLTILDIKQSGIN